MHLSAQIRPASWDTAAGTRGREWARRLRVRWGGRFATVPESDRLELPELRSKAVRTVDPIA